MFKSMVLVRPSHRPWKNSILIRGAGFHRVFVRTILTIMLTTLVAHAVAAQEPPPLDVLYREFERLGLERKYAEGLSLAESILAREEAEHGRLHTNTAYALVLMGNAAMRLRQYDRAETAYSNSWQIRATLLGTNHPLVGRALNNLGQLYQKTQQWTNAEAAFRAAGLIWEKVGHVDPRLEIATAEGLGEIYRKTGRPARAEQFLLRSLALNESRGSNSPGTLSAAFDLGQLYYELERFGAAEQMWRRALALRENTTRTDRTELAVNLRFIGNACMRQKRRQEAKALYLRALGTFHEVLPENHPDTAYTWFDLGQLYAEEEDYNNAERCLQRTLDIEKAARGEKSAGYGAILHGFGNLRRKQGRLEEAEQILQQSWNLRTNHNPSAAVSGLYNDLGLVAMERFAYDLAEERLRMALRLAEREDGSKSGGVADARNNLAVLYDRTGQPDKAEAMFREAIEVEKQIHQTNELGYLVPLTSLAYILESRGSFHEATLTFERAKRIAEQYLPRDHPDYAYILGGLGNLRSELADVAGARRYLNQALEIRERLYGTNSAELASTLNNLAILYDSTNDAPRAIALYERCLRLNEQSFGTNHPARSDYLNNLAGVYRRLGDLTKARALREQVVAIREAMARPDPIELANGLNNLSALCLEQGELSNALYYGERALRLVTNAASPLHPKARSCFDNLAFVYRDLNRPEDALQMAMFHQAAHFQRLSNVLSFASEAERMAFLSENQGTSPLATIGNAPEIAQILIRQKGVVLDSLLEDRRIAEKSANPEHAQLVSAWRAARQRLSALTTVEPSPGLEQARAQAQAWRESVRRVRELESELARRGTDVRGGRLALTVTTEMIQAAMPPDAVFLDFLAYRHDLGRGQAERRYGALVLGPTGEPRWTSLDRVSEIDAQIAQCRAVLSGADERALAGRDLLEALRTLHAMLWNRLQPLLPPKARTLIICPDGQLNFLSFATLLGPEDKFLLETHDVVYVASARDLLGSRSTPAAPSLRILANPDFDTLPSSRPLSVVYALRGADQDATSTLSFDPLAGTAREAKLLGELALKLGWKPEVITGGNASEACLRSMAPPHILHLATHGFFLDANDSSLARSSRASSTSGRTPGSADLRDDDGFRHVRNDPMRRSGLALSGAQATLRAWSRGETPSPDNDGMLYAEDVATLPLDGTWLVTLSICDAGLGQARSGQGVLGLRRGFAQAGAQHLLLTLGRVSDIETTQFMVEFYEALRKTRDPAPALSQTQRVALARFRQSSGGLVKAVRTVGPFILSRLSPPH